MTAWCVKIWRLNALRVSKLASEVRFVPEYCSTLGPLTIDMASTRRACAFALARLCTVILGLKNPLFRAWRGDDAKCTHVFVLKTAKGNLLFLITTKSSSFASRNSIKAILSLLQK